MIAGRPIIALGIGGVAGYGLAGRTWLVARMDAVRRTMTAEDGPGTARFRRFHIAGMVLNLVLLGCFCFALTRLSL